MLVFRWAVRAFSSASFRYTRSRRTGRMLWLVTQLPNGIDTSVPHPARVYGYWLGGKDHFDADRQAAEEVMRLRPQVVASAQANRAYLARVVRFLAGECGIRQVLDIGAGLPGQQGGNTHEVAQQVDPGCRVVYCDNDRSLPGSVHAVGASHVGG